MFDVNTIFAQGILRSSESNLEYMQELFDVQVFASSGIP